MVKLLWNGFYRITRWKVSKPWEIYNAHYVISECGSVLKLWL